MNPTMIARLLALLVFAMIGAVCALTSAPHTAPTEAPSVAPACEAPAGARFNPCAVLDTTQVQDRRPTEADCRATAAGIFESQDYTGSDRETACFGAEDDPRVGLALDYGMTESQYAESEAAQGGSYTNPHPGVAS